MQNPPPENENDEDCADEMDMDHADKTDMDHLTFRNFEIDPNLLYKCLADAQLFTKTPAKPRLGKHINLFDVDNPNIVSKYPEDYEILHIDEKKNNYISATSQIGNVSSVNFLLYYLYYIYYECMAIKSLL